VADRRAPVAAACATRGRISVRGRPRREPGWPRAATWGRTHGVWRPS